LVGSTTAPLHVLTIELASVAAVVTAAAAVVVTASVDGVVTAVESTRAVDAGAGSVAGG
jgi:hypothetical protein